MQPGCCTGAQPVSLLPSHTLTLVSPPGGKELPHPLSLWAKTDFAHNYCWHPKDLLETRPQGGWPASEHLGALGTRGVGVRGQGQWHPLVPPSLQSSLVLITLALGGTNVCVGDIPGVSGWRLQARWGNCRQLVTYVQKLPSVLRVESYPWLQARHLSLEAQRRPVATPSHTRSHSPCGPGRGWADPCRWGVGLKSWNACR